VSDKGRLDGLVLFRFGQIYQRGGGIEEHLNTVDRLLLERNRMTILRAFLANRGEEHSIKTDRVGKGLLIWVPVEQLDYQDPQMPINLSPFLNLMTSHMRGVVGAALARAVGRIISISPLRKKTWLRISCKNIGSLIYQLHRQYGIQLGVIHTLFGADEATVMNDLMKLSVPFAVINHFENSRLAHPMSKLMIRGAAAVGVVSTVRVPHSLQHRISPIIEGVDGDFFQLEYASSLEDQKGGNNIFLPARIAHSKGQVDAVRALSLLERQGIAANLIIAGRISSESAVTELNEMVAHLRCSGRVLILGELDRDALRNWYAACAVVILPSYIEALGRTLLEAQLMKRPVIAYNVGGVSQAMLDGLTGFLVRKGNVAGLAMRLGQLLTDMPTRSRMGEAGRMFVVERFRLRRMVETHEDLYVQALARIGSS
jgi:glycosyltransferase involved in cell wall biosynthesis